MKRYKRVFILLGTAVIVCIATLIVTRTQKKQEKIRESGAVILAVDPDTVTALAWEYDGTAFDFTRDETWQRKDDAAFPVDGEAIRDLLETFESFAAAFVIEEVEDFGPYGLDDPTGTVRFTAEGEDYEVQLGDYSTLDQQRYVSIGDGNVYLAVSDPLDTFDVSLQDLILHDDIPYIDQPTEIRFSGSENYTIEYIPDSGRTVCADDVYFTSDGKVLDTDRVNEYLYGLEYTGLTDYVTYSAAEDLAVYGLDTPELDITVTWQGETEEETVTLHIGRDPNQQEDDSVTAYARVGDSPIVYQLAQTTYEALMQASYNDLRHREILTMELTELTQLDLTLDGSTYTVTVKDEDGVWSCYYGEENVVAAGLSGALTGLTVSDFTAAASGGKEEIRFTAYLSREEFSPISVIFLRYNGESCLALVDGETVGLIDRACVVDLVEAVNSIVLG